MAPFGHKFYFSCKNISPEKYLCMRSSFQYRLFPQNFNHPKLQNILIVLSLVCLKNKLECKIRIKIVINISKIHSWGLAQMAEHSLRKILSSKEPHSRQTNQITPGFFRMRWIVCMHARPYFFKTHLLSKWSQKAVTNQSEWKVPLFPVKIAHW